MNLLEKSFSRYKTIHNRMSDAPIHILLIENIEKEYKHLKQIISDSPYLANTKLSRVNNVVDAKSLHLAENFDLIFLDFDSKNQSHINFIEEIALSSNVPLIALIKDDNREADIMAMQAGASDFWIKSELNVSSIERCIRYNLERKINLEILKNESKRFRQLYNLSFDADFVLDGEFNIIQTNNAFDKLFGENNESLKKLFTDDFIYKSFINTLNNEGKIFSKEFKFNGINKTKLCIISISSYLNEVTGEKEYQGTIRDISKHRRIEEKAKRQEKVNATGIMARTIAHEIRNPLSNISLSLGEIEAIDNEENTSTYYEIIRNSCHRINEIVTDFINNTKFENLNLENGNIHDVLNIAIDECKDKLELKEIQLDLDLKAQNLIKIDLEKLPIVFTNLIVNAVEALDKTKSPKISITSYDEEEGVVVVVKDNGIGMDNETQKKIFSNFFTQKTNGIGVGMSAIYNLLAAHDAHIEVESELGVGTKFIIYFD